MFGIESLIGNKTVRNAVLGKLRDIMKSEGLEYIVISLDPADGGLLLDMHKPGEILITPGPEANLISEPIKPESNEIEDSQ